MMTGGYIGAFGYYKAQACLSDTPADKLNDPQEILLIPPADVAQKAQAAPIPAKPAIPKVCSQLSNYLCLGNF